MQKLELKLGDCIERMAELPESSVDAIVTDPPYGLSFMNKDFDKLGVADEQAQWHIKWLEQAYRVLKPGAEIWAYGGTRTYHRLAQAMRAVGFQDLSVKEWNYGSGFPKSLNVSKKMDQMAKAERPIVGYTRGVGGENMNDIVRGGEVRTTDQEGAKGVGAYGTGAKQTAITIPITAPATENAKKWAGYGTALKPSHEPVVVGRKPL